MTGTSNALSRSDASAEGRYRVSGLFVRTAAHLLFDDTVRPRDALLGDWLLERGLALLYAPTGIGKSWFSMAIAAAVASGTQLHVWDAPQPQRVLYVDGEMDLSDLRERLGVVVKAVPTGPLGRNLTICSRRDQPDGTPFPNLGDDAGQRQFLELAKKMRPALIVLDNVSTLVSVAEENEAGAWDPFLKMLQALQQAGSAVLVVHHSNKAGGYRGSSKIAVLFDTILKLSPHDTAGAVNGAAFTITFEKTRRLVSEARSGIGASLVEGKWSFDPLFDSILVDLCAKVRQGEFQFQADIAKALDVAEGTISKMKRKAIAAGLITVNDWDDGLKLGRTLAREETSEPADDF